MLKVVLTGIPSSGKTSVINSVVERFKEQGYRVLIVPETATEYITSGIKPFGEDGIDPIVFQELVLKKQLNKEALYDLAAHHLGEEKTIILYDRGTLDGYAYVPTEEMEKVVKECHKTKRDLLLRYDAILFLEGAEKFFTKENNKARYEKNAAEAAALRKKLLNSYLGHDNLRIIQPREEMKDKQEEVINIIANMLGNPTRLREQHKYLVESIDIDSLSDVASKVDIVQDYLQAPDGMEYRLREIKQGTDTSYHFSIQKKHENGKREITKEEVVSKEEYLRMLALRSEEVATVKKVRYSFVHANQYYKLDVFDDGMILLEVNLTKENPTVTLPNFITTLDDVTNNPDYTNISIARRKKEDYDKRKDNSSGGHRLFR